MLKKKKGKIINISSLWGIAGASCEVAYSAAKAGIIGFTRALAKEVAPAGITVNCIAPGIVLTDMMKNFTTDELSSLAQETPMRRFGDPFEIASAAVYLASSGADFITGQLLSPNGVLVI